MLIGLLEVSLKKRSNHSSFLGCETKESYLAVSIISYSVALTVALACVFDATSL